MPVMAQLEAAGAGPGTYEPGAQVAVEYEDEPGTFHARLVLRAARPGALTAVMELNALDETKVYWILTPDGDIYPEELSVPPLSAYCQCDEEGDLRRRGGMTPVGRRCRRFYAFGEGSVEELTPLVVCRAMTAAEREDNRYRDGGAPALLPIAVPGAGAAPARAAAPEEDAEEVDARVLAVARDPSGVRSRPFRETVALLTETAWDAWPVTGPRTLLWCCKFIARHSLHPLAHHTRFLQLAGVTGADAGAQEHEHCMRIIEFAVCYDQVQVSELAALEMVARRAQMVELRFREKVIGTGGGVSVDDDAFLYMGTGKTRGLLMVCPLLEEYVADELSKETAAAKERCKLREERSGGPLRPQPKK